MDKSKLPSRHTTVGPERAPHRSYYYAMGLDEAQIAQPIVGVVSSWNEAAPCNISLRRQAEAAKRQLTEVDPANGNKRVIAADLPGFGDSALPPTGGDADALTAKREGYFATAQANSGNTKIDAGIDIDGGIGTLARAGYELFDQLGSIGLTSFMQEITRVRALEGEIARLDRDPGDQNVRPCAAYRLGDGYPLVVPEVNMIPNGSIGSGSRGVHDAASP